MRTTLPGTPGLLRVLAIAATALATTAAPLAAQQTTREQTIMWTAASSARDGYIHGTARLKWLPQICGGNLQIVYGLVAGSALGYEGYWYQGVNYGLRSDFVPPRQPDGRFTARIAIGAQTVKTVDISPKTGASSGCFSAVNFITAGSVKDFLKPGATAADREALLDGVSFDLSVSHQPMRSGVVERTIRNELTAARAKARRDSAELARAERAQRDSADRARRAVAQAQQRDSVARERLARRQPASRDSATRSAAPSDRRAETRASAPAPTAAESRAERARLAEQEAAAQRAQRAADAERVQEQLRAQAAEREAANRRREEGLTSAATTAATIAGGTGGAFGAYYLAMDDAPARSTSYTFESLSGLGLGLNWRFAYVDGGIVNATYTDNYVAKQSGATKENQGYFVGGGLVLDLPASPSFSFGPSLGYTMVETADASTSGMHAGFLVRISSLKFRFDIGSAEQSYYGVGAYLQF
jgi:hypothetical protein